MLARVRVCRQGCVQRMCACVQWERVLVRACVQVGACVQVCMLHPCVHGADLHERALQMSTFHHLFVLGGRSLDKRRPGRFFGSGRIRPGRVGS